ncbi:hypothetical protein H6F93_26020 [Leptolyngbya sp. FACHB-671]|uniref:hypothetical protein n=1 Tax=Leptolyngbya sp. FACHB-671 TaxID=2692812 RepID=UPI001684E5F3|nr:hypothetical protein [Leptolyngbya sp. FACHB-671]MBD2070931.1 hypothetical protein [Leptolyngbya sp. FACHB-671]
MTKAEIEAVLKAAFGKCEAAGYPLEAEQKQILLAAAIALSQSQSAGTASQNGSSETDSPPIEPENPLNELTPEQRTALLQFIQMQEQEGIPWKVQLLNDWLEGRESGAIQFIRDLYGPQWLEQVQPFHVAEYAETAVSLKLGDRIEVSNNLWEWVQEEGPCSREWFGCTVIHVSQASDSNGIMPASYSTYTNCMIRFDNGMEYEIQGVYEWNRYNWRWLK